MTSILTKEEQEFMQKIEQQRLKHNEAQKKYRLNHIQQVQSYNKTYNENKKRKRDEINNKLMKTNEAPKKIELKEFTEPQKIDKRKRRGKKQAEMEQTKPSFKTRREPLEYSTMDDYLRKANILNKFYNERDLPQTVKAELKKMLNDNTNINEKIILDEMKYIHKDIETTIKKLREKYANDNTFKSYINVLSVITSHFKVLNNVYQTFTKIGKSLNMKVQETREENELDDEDEGKIINLDKSEILQNIDKIDKIDDKLLYGLYTLTPARRLDYRNMLITNEKDENKLKETNYLILSNPKRFVFNDYKTYKTYGKQVFIVPSELDSIISKYLIMKDLNNGDYLIPLERNKKEAISQGNFSKRIAYVFKQIYSIPISVRYLRMSWASYLYSQNPTAKKIKEITNMMAHSASESRLYNKIS